METKRAVAIQGQANLFSEGPSQKARSLGRGIERQFDVAFVSGLALREKQIQQNYRPIIAVHKWFARRPGTLFRALLLSEFVEGTLKETFYESHDLAGIQIADPFMGGGTPLLEANRLGCSVFGYDINPMAYWVVKQEIEELDLRKYREAAAEIGQLLGSVLSEAASLGVCSPAARSLWREPSRGGGAECRTGRPDGLPRGSGFRGACRGERARGGNGAGAPPVCGSGAVPLARGHSLARPARAGWRVSGDSYLADALEEERGGEQGCKHLAAANESALSAAPLLRAPHPAVGANGRLKSRPAWAAPEGACGPNSLRPGRPWVSRRAFRSRRAKPRPAPGQRRYARSE